MIMLNKVYSIILLGLLAIAVLISSARSEISDDVKLGWKYGTAYDLGVITKTEGSSIPEKFEDMIEYVAVAVNEDKRGLFYDEIMCYIQNDNMFQSVVKIALDIFRELPSTLDASQFKQIKYNIYAEASEELSICGEDYPITIDENVDLEIENTTIRRYAMSFPMFIALDMLIRGE